MSKALTKKTKRSRSRIYYLISYWTSLKYKIINFFKKLRKPNERRKLFGILVVSFLLWIAFEYFSLPTGKEYITNRPKLTPLMLLRENEALLQGRRFSLSYHWVPISKIPNSLIRSVLAGEDFSFFEHEGFDFGEISQVIIDFFSHLRAPRGASTITQQLAKNLYLSQSKSPVRKIKEAIITRRLERNLSKWRILELYLNIIEWGDGVFGAEAASRYYFNKSVESIDQLQSAKLAAIIPAPLTTYNPKTQSVRVGKRQIILLNKMHKIRIPTGAR